MRNPVLGQTYHTVVPVTDAAGYLVDADALPTGTVYVDGVASATVVTIADIGVGLYHVSYAMTAGEGFAQGNGVSLLFFPTIGGVTTGKRIDQFYISPADWTGPSAVTLTVRNSVTLVGIAGAVVNVLDSTAVYPCARTVTNGSGVAVLYLGNGSYKVRCASAAYTFADATLTVSGATALTVNGVAFTAHPNPILVILASAIGTVTPNAPVEIAYGDDVCLEFHVTHRDGTTPYDLSIATSITCYVREVGSTAVATSGAATPTNALLGVVQYRLQTVLLGHEGHYHAECVVVMPDGEDTAPAARALELRIRKSVGP